MSSFHIEIVAGGEVHEGDMFTGTEIPVIVIGGHYDPVSGMTVLGKSLLTAEDAIAARLLLGIGESGSPADADVAGLLADPESQSRIVLQGVIDEATELPDLVEAFRNASTE